MHKCGILKNQELLLRCQYGYTTRKYVFSKPKHSLGLLNLTDKLVTSSLGFNQLMGMSSADVKNATIRINILVQQLQEEDQVVNFIRFAFF